MLQTIINQLLDSEITTLGSIFKMLLSLALGGAIGYERKRKGQIAGVRTFALISMGATLAMILSIYVPQEYLGLKNGDPARIAAQVITGIGFLGAGAIIQMKGGAWPHHCCRNMDGGCHWHVGGSGHVCNCCRVDIAYPCHSHSLRTL